MKAASMELWYIRYNNTYSICSSTTIHNPLSGVCHIAPDIIITQLNILWRYKLRPFKRPRVYMVLQNTNICFFDNASKKLLENNYTFWNSMKLYNITITNLCEPRCIFRPLEVGHDVIDSKSTNFQSASSESVFAVPAHVAEEKGKFQLFRAAVGCCMRSCCVQGRQCGVVVASLLPPLLASGYAPQ